jgi:hypothetical protein
MPAYHKKYLKPSHIFYISLICGVHLSSLTFYPAACLVTAYCQTIKPAMEVWPALL